MRTLFVILAVLLLGVGYSGPPRLPLYGPHATLHADPLAPPAGLRVGRLTWLGGVRLIGDDAAFGGFSAMTTARGRFTLLSDGGNLVGFGLTQDWHVHDARFRELPGGPRGGWEKRDRDAESLTFAPDGRSWAGFESANAIWRYDRGFVHVEGGVRPRAMRRWPIGGGAEAMVRLRDGRFVLLSEGGSWPGRGGRAGIVFMGDPVARPNAGFGFTYRPAPGFEPVDAAELPDGNLLVLEREWRLPLRFGTRLALVANKALRPGARVRGQEVARFRAPLPNENYEALAITREAGVTIVWLASDNDQSWWRSSYLLKFRLESPAIRRRR
ncbi:MAG: esterase-like activity of phytase family protein [Pseudomonadota bacterium]